MTYVGELDELRAWRDATVPIIGALAIYGEGVNVAALVAKARELNQADEPDEPDEAGE